MQLVILDRDGVINHDSDEYIKSVDEWEPIPGSLSAIARLNHAGFRVVVASNQSGLARRLFTMEDLTRMHTKMQRLLSEEGGNIDAIFFCPHAPRDDCHCRKPRTGLFEDIQTRLGVSLEGVPVVGDSLKDLQAAADIGAMPILVRTGKGSITEPLLADSPFRDVPVFDNLEAVTEYLLTQQAG